MKDKIKRFYDLHLWSKAMVANAVIKEIITAAEYQEITGETYNNSGEPNT